MAASSCQGPSRRVRLGDHRGPPGAKDACFLAADFFARRPEVIDVIDADAREHSAIRIDHVDRIQASAQAHFEDCGLDFLARKEPQRRERAELEVGQRRFTAHCFYRFEAFDQS